MARLGYIDVGSSSARIMIPLPAENDEEEEVIVVKRPAQGRGREGFTNFEQLKADFKLVVEEARRELGSPELPHCCVAVQDIEAITEVRSIKVNTKGKTLSDKDILFVKKNINIEDPHGYIPLHRIPIGFRVDDGDLHPNPVGMVCETLSFYVMYIAVRRIELRQYSKLMREAGVLVRRYMYDGLMHGLAAIRDQKATTATVLDLGANKTGVCVFEKGYPVFLSAGSLGMELLTRELKSQLRCSTDQAEKLKIDKGMGAKGNAIGYLLSDNKTKNSVDVPQFVNILRVQLNNVLQTAKKQLEANTWPEPSPSYYSQYIITGGGRSMSDLLRVAGTLLKADVSIARGSVHSDGDKAFMACVGMRFYVEGDDFHEAEFLKEVRVKMNTQNGIMGWLKNVFS